MTKYCKLQKSYILPKHFVPKLVASNVPWSIFYVSSISEIRNHTNVQTIKSLIFFTISGFRIGWLPGRKMRPLLTKEFPWFLSGLVYIYIYIYKEFGVYIKEHSSPTTQLRKILTDNTTILEHQNDKQKLQILEALHIRNMQPTLNRINFQTSAIVLKCL